MIWNRAAIDTARQLALDGHSAAEAARHFTETLDLRPALTRDAVIAACLRRDIHFVGRNVNAGRAAALGPSPDAKPMRKLRGSGVADMPLVAIVDLRSVHCRWPIECDGDDAVRYCGHDRVAPGPYCAAHRKLAYVPRAPK